ncbi:antigen 5 like allergen Cul n 1-like [Bradysia coprophila]|uniref:antigen 5 like allergen Cul n 1-like n=1 Tax=Bradysia coprophila TaxID=38358 RepID=UPI00187D9F8D|nr:antigen 5 like allergen Cul n 1-like [Bradysia coprophila]
MKLELIVLVVCVALATGQDWCNIASCAPNAHVACNHDGNFHQDCRRPAAVTLTAANIQSILDRHNNFRSLTAVGHTLGRDGNLPTAVRMAQLRWDPTLAHLAGLNVRRCLVRQDNCRNTEQFNAVGQNVGTMFFLGNMPADIIINTVTDAWFDERRLTLQSDIASVVTGRLFDMGRFANAVNERQTHVGCAISMFDQDSGSTLWRVGLLACNYASTNFGGTPIYRSGPVGSQCELGTDGTFPGLCTLNEPINPNV